MSQAKLYKNCPRSRGNSHFSQGNGRGVDRKKFLPSKRVVRGGPFQGGVWGCKQTVEEKLLEHAIFLIHVG